jgi:hypothetical protein
MLTDGVLDGASTCDAHGHYALKRLIGTHAGLVGDGALCSAYGVLQTGHL